MRLGLSHDTHFSTRYEKTEPYKDSKLRKSVYCDNSSDEHQSHSGAMCYLNFLPGANQSTEPDLTLFRSRFISTFTGTNTFSSRWRHCYITIATWNIRIAFPIYHRRFLSAKKSFHRHFTHNGLNPSDILNFSMRKHDIIFSNILSTALKSVWYSPTNLRQ